MQDAISAPAVGGIVRLTRFILKGTFLVELLGALALLADDGLSQPGIVVKTSSPKGEHERLPNPTLAVTDGSVTVKFHPWSIEQIVASEQADT